MRVENSGRAVVSLLLAGVLAQADTLVLRNGNHVDGSYLGGDNKVVRFAVYDRVQTFNLSEIETIRFTGMNGETAGTQPGYPPAPPSPPTTYAPPAPPRPASNGSVYTQDQPPVPPQTNEGNRTSNDRQSYNSPAVQVPAGTEITVRLIDPVDSQNDRLGQTYRASLDQPVVVNGQTVLPRGADAVATLIEAQRSGKIEGRTSLTLDLKSVTVNGRQYDITTTGVSQESSSRGAKSAKVIGGTTALGAIIGAVAGGGRGAAIGAGSGAAAGTAAQVITSGQRVKVPAETRLSFTLQNPVNM